MSGLRGIIEHMFEGFVDESTPAPLAGVVPGPELGEYLIAAELLAPEPAPADHTPSGEAAWQAATSEGLDRVAGWARMTAWGQAQEMLAVEALVSGAVRRAEQRPPGTLLDDHVGGVSAQVDSLVAELALTWQVAQRTAQRRVDEAVSLVGGLPLLIEAMLDGRLGLAHVRAVSAILLDLEPDLRERICRDLLHGAPSGHQIARTPAQLAATARRAAVRLDPGSARRRERAARRARGVHLGAEDHGMATVTAYLPAAEALLLYRTVDAHARGVAASDDEGERTRDARRADALSDLVALGALAAAGAAPETDDIGEAADETTGETAGEATGEAAGAGGAGPCSCRPPGGPARGRSAEDESDARRPVGDESPTPVPAPRAPADDSGAGAGAGPPSPATPTSPPPEAQGRPRRARARAPRTVQVRVVVPADTLLGLDDHPAELVGYGPITAEAARELAAEADATWRRILTDPVSGAVLDVGHRRYRPPAAMAEHVRNRDLHCTFPGCRVPAQACDLDHVVRFDPDDPDGRTAADNLDPDCRHHHRIKHLPGWAVSRGPDGSLLWTTPSGRRFRTVRPVLFPIRTEPPRGAGPTSAEPPDEAGDEPGTTRLRPPEPAGTRRGHLDDPPF